ncbi:DUF2335 domain-containing protein [candidate division KSB1 bacterium]|nr:DUF2335 domain-containing protein [candidate division KSB1 bacterium]MBL7093983.1 DUF2335 domain-containing protein [candidate division KSB1 bacterium]
MAKKQKKTKKILQETSKDIPVDLPPPIQDILNDIPESKRQSALQKFEFIYSYIGIIPPPDDLREYDKIIPRGADRIMIQAEQQSAHRIELEKRAINSQISQSRTGQWMAFIIALVSLELLIFWLQQAKKRLRVF